MTDNDTHREWRKLHGDDEPDNAPRAPDTITKRQAYYRAVAEGRIAKDDWQYFIGDDDPKGDAI